MAEVTITVGSEPALIKNPNIEIAQVTVTNGETYTSRKFRKVEGCIPCLNMASFSDEFISAELSTTVDSQVIIHTAGSDTTDEKVTLLLWGEP